MFSVSERDASVPLPPWGIKARKVGRILFVINAVIAWVIAVVDFDFLNEGAWLAVRWIIFASMVASLLLWAIAARAWRRLGWRRSP